MSLEELMCAPIILKEDCIFCKVSGEGVGFNDKKGAVKIFETGQDLNEDWYAMLQPDVVSDPETGFRILLLPTGHITSFCQIGKNPQLTKNYGLGFANLSIAMQKIREGESRQSYLPLQIVSAKCYTAENTREHLHFKFDEPSGGLAQPFPVDAGWVKKELCGLYVRANPVVKSKLSEERVQSLAERLITYLNE